MASSWTSQYASKPILTELAKKYTHPTGPRYELLATQYFLKSGLTPLELTDFPTVEEYIYQWALDEYQASEFLGIGFTTAELRNLDAFAPSLDDPVDLTLDSLPIHPIYARENWTKAPKLKHNPGYLIGDNISEGYYDASNPIVWEAIRPALRIASQILMNAKGCAWKIIMTTPSAALYVYVIQINDAWAKFPCKYRRIRSRPPYISGTVEAHEQVQQRLLRAANIIHFAFTDSRNFGANGMEGTLGSCYAFVVDNVNPVLFMSTQAVTSLLNPNLTTAERALDTFRFAAILAHETVHALNRADKGDDRGLFDKVYGAAEPYFENEPISELGWSLENAVFVGPPREITGNIPLSGAPSSGAVMKRTWPDWLASYPAEPAPWRNAGLLKTVKGPRWWQNRVSAIPCWYYINLHNPSYWHAYTRRYGTMSIQMEPETVCRDLVADPATNDANLVRNSPATARNINRLRHRPYVDITGDMSPAAVIEATVENQRRAYADRINQRIFSRMNAVGAYNKSANPVRLRAVAEVNAGRKPLIPPPYPESKVCPIFNYIQDYLFRNRLKLALDTMRILPENLLHHYILENGGLNIGVSMWRLFLVDYTTRNILFEWMDIGSGQIRRNPLGWPTLKLPERPRPPGRKPNDTTMATFHNCANSILYNKPKDVIASVWDPFTRGLEDHDLEDFRRRIVAEYTRSYKAVKFGFLGNRVVFDRQTMDLILYYCDRDANVFIYGPRGIIRFAHRGTAQDPVKSKDEKSPPGDGCKPQ